MATDPPLASERTTFPSPPRSPDAVADSRLTARSVPLRHRRWRLEIRGDEVAAISYDGVLLLRAVRPVVRDEDWNTVPVRVVSQAPPVEADAPLDSLQIDLLFEAREIRYAGTLTLTLDEHTLSIDFRGRALSAFNRNRIGLVVLHPPDDAGRQVDVVATDGSVQSSSWPIAISPHQPFFDVSGFRWSKDGVQAELTLSGDVFETEDQRNWTDASFKTYSTPLSIPFPVAVADGDTVEQRVVLRADGQRRSTASRPSGAVTVTDTVIGTVPAIGLGAFVQPGSGEPYASAGRSGRFATVLLELVEPEADWPRQIQLAERQATDLGAELDIRIVADESEMIERAIDGLALPAVARLAVFDPHRHTTTRDLWKALAAASRRRGFDRALLAGTRAHFTELNRQFSHLPAEASELTFSVTPQMHATEVPHIVDSLTGQRLVAENSVRLAGGRPVHVGPVTLARRFNAVATSTASDPATNAQRAIDQLQSTDFTAAWTLGSVAALSVPGIVSLTYYETSGPRGIRGDGARPYPVADVLERVAAWRGLPVLETTCPPGVAAYAVRSTTGPLVSLANLNASPVEVTVEVGGNRHPVRLMPWSVGHLTP